MHTKEVFKNKCSYDLLLVNVWFAYPFYRSAYLVSCKNFSWEELEKCLSRRRRCHASIKTWVQPQHPIGSLGVSACTHSPCAWREKNPGGASWSVSLNYWAPGSMRNPDSKSKVESHCEGPWHWPLASKGTQVVPWNFIFTHDSWG